MKLPGGLDAGWAERPSAVLPGGCWFINDRRDLGEVATGMLCKAQYSKSAELAPGAGLYVAVCSWGESLRLSE